MDKMKYFAYRVFWAVTRPNPLNFTKYHAKLFFGAAEKRNNQLAMFLLKSSRSHKVFFDIGANCGYFSKAMCMNGYNGRIVLFEPIANLLSIAVDTLSKKNNEKHFINCAAGDVEGEETFFFDNRSNVGWITSVKEKINAYKSVTANIVPISRFLGDHLPDMVKIDVEGSELPILQAILRHVSSDYHPSVLVEIAWGVSNPRWKEYQDIFVNFEAAGYKFFDCDLELKAISVEKLSNLGKTTDVLLEYGH